MLHSARALRSYCAHCARGIFSPWFEEKKERKIPRRGMLRITRRNLLVCGANARGTRIRARRLLTPPEKTEGLRGYRCNRRDFPRALEKECGLPRLSSGTWRFPSTVEARRQKRSMPGRHRAATSCTVCSIRNSTHI